MKKPVIDVKYVAELARLELTPGELEKFSRQITDILGYMEKINEVMVDDTPMTTHVIKVKNILREDVVKEPMPLSDVLGNAPSKEGDFISVPKVIEG